MERIVIREKVLRLQNMGDWMNLINALSVHMGGAKYQYGKADLLGFADLRGWERKFRTFHIPKKHGGKRTISAPKDDLFRQLLCCINEILQAVYEAPDCATGFIPGKSIVTNAQMHVGKQYVFNVDLKDFFLSVSCDAVSEALQQPPFSWKPEWARMIASICCMNSYVEGIPAPTACCLPQGAPTSPMLTNIVCRELDKQLMELAARYGMVYSRYADDMTFSADTDVFGDDFKRELSEIIHQHGLELNEKKTRLQHRGQRQEVTGLMVTERVNVSRRYVRSLRNLFYIWERYGAQAASRSLAKVYKPEHPGKKGTPDLPEVVHGKLMYLKMVKGESDPVFQKLYSKYCYLAKHKPRRA